MKKSRIISLIAALAIASTMFAGCGGDTSSSSSTDGSSSTDSSKPSGEVEVMRFVSPGTMPSDAETGLKAVNDKLVADGVNIKVEPIRIPWDAFDQKLNLMLSTGEEFEMMHVMQDVKNISSLASRNALTPVDEYIDNYPDLKALFTDEEWKAGVYQGKIYGVPARWRSFDGALGYTFARTDVMDKFTEGKDPTTVEEYIEVSKKMQAEIEAEVGKKAYSWPHQLAVPPSNFHRTYDTYPFYVENSIGLIIARQDGTADSFYESEEFKKDSTYFREMYKAGLIHPDILNAVHTQKYDEFKIGAALPSNTFGYGDRVGLQENIPTATVGHFFLAPEKQQVIYTLSQNLNAISATAKNPESGLKFLDWLYKDKANHDLFHYGIEGTHYTASADNRIKQIKGDDNQPLYTFDTWMTGLVDYMRYDELYPDEGIAFDQMDLEDDQKVYSPIAGFLFDASNVQSELANLETEIKASIYPIKYGLVDYDKEYPKAIEKLKKAGLDKYLEEYRAQLKAYLEANPDALEAAK